ncbi:hypothetical protein G7054_g8067 [Neopestalotiopsis clavispora]|nr:hypothetical protein G7054_g8067 [Neopestalotiopsis clavispora]
MEFDGPRNRSFNLRRFKAAARREARGHPWDIPFASKRTSTTGDLEHGAEPIEIPSRVNCDDDIIDSPQKEHTKCPTFSSKEIYTDPKKSGVQLEPASVKFGFIRHVEPKGPYTFANQLRSTLSGSRALLLLPCVPAGIALQFAIGDSIPTFIVNFAALIPLNSLSDLALDEIKLRVTGLGRGFLYISCGVDSPAASKEYSTAANNSHRWPTRKFASHLRIKDVAHTSANLLSLAATSLLIPTASKLLGQINPQDIPKQSRGTAFVLLMIYACYLLYQFKSHVQLFKTESEKVERKSLRKRFSKEGLIPSIKVTDTEADTLALPQLRGLEDVDDDEEEEYDRATLAGYVALAIFVGASTLLALCVDYTVNSIDALSTGANLSQTFIGLVLLPIPNCDTGPIKRATYDRLDETMNDTIGKCLQTALFVTPLTVLIAWGMGVDEMTMVFDGFEIVSLFAAILLLNLLMERGEVTWIQGCLLLGDWALVAISAFFAKQATSGS